MIGTSMVGNKILGFVKDNIVLVVASILAFVSCFIVPPDGQYASYIHVNTIMQLVCLMIVVCGFQRIGAFQIIGSRLLHYVHTESGLVVTLVCLTFFSAMFITNDVALVTFVPFALAVLVMAKMERTVVLVVTLMTIGANTGSMLTPIGNAHNLYFKAISGFGTLRFLSIMGPYSLLSAILLFAIIIVAFRGQRTQADFESLDARSIEQSTLAPFTEKERPNEIRIGGYGIGGNNVWRAVVYAVLFLVCALTVSGFVPLWVMVALVFVGFVLCDRRVFLKVDWALPLTFIMFFVFIGNMRRVPAFSSLAASVVGAHPLAVSIVSSQLISNVPTSILLSGFCRLWKPLIIGTNIGGLGTIIASMASLVSYQQVARRYPDRKGHYLLVYSLVNVAFVAVLFGLSLIIG